MSTPPSKKQHNSEVPARIRDIVTKSISNLDADKDEAANLIAENQQLKNELTRVEDRLSSIRADRQTHSLNFNSYHDSSRVSFLQFPSILFLKNSFSEII